MVGQNNSPKVKNVQTLIIIGISLVVPVLIVLTTIVSEKRNATVTSDGSAQAYVKEIDDWHAKRINNLKREHGWLSLVALQWMKEGKNHIDSLGEATLQRGRVRIDIDPRVAATLNGVRFTSGMVKTDQDTAGADTVVNGSRAFTVIKRGDQFAMRVWDANAAQRTQLVDIERYPVSQRWKVDARWEHYQVPKKVQIETAIPGMVDTGMVTGVAIFTLDDKEYRLEPIIEDGVSDYFFIIGDATNGRETYGGGRYLYSAPPKNGKIVLDFNKLTNPPCVFTDFATCPRPFPGNRLAVRIEAGEKKYGAH
ncbi:MAG TPA: DUF1684 domain-containing protein [Bacteroidota bacterium]|nr:DUF1684 domain-containing protein [Bacteroidota bacterium]